MELKLVYVKPKSRTKPEQKYYVSDTGNVYMEKYGIKTELAKVRSGHKGQYLSASVGKGQREYIHRLVYTAFVGPIPEGKEIDHIDGNKHNNNLSNLRCVWPHENAQHRSRLGRHGQGRTYGLYNLYKNKELLLEKATAKECARFLDCKVQKIYAAVSYERLIDGVKCIRVGTKSSSIYGKPLE